MNLLDVTDYGRESADGSASCVSNKRVLSARAPGGKFVVQRYPLFILAGIAFIAAWTIHQISFSLALLSLTIFGAARDHIAGRV